MNGYEIIGIVLLMVSMAGLGFLAGYAARGFDAQREDMRVQGQAMRDHNYELTPDPYHDRKPTHRTKP